MALQEAYGQTDVMRDPRYLDALMQGRNPRDRRRARLSTEQLDREAARGQRSEEFYFRQAALKSQMEENRRSREDVNRENELGRSERSKQHTDLLRASQADTQTRNMISAMTALSYDQSPEGKAMLRQLQAAYAQKIGLKGVAPTTAATPGTPAATTGGKGEYGPGGAPATGAAPATTYTQPTQTFTEEPPNVGPTGAVDQGLGFAPNGYPILPNTPEQRFVPLGAAPLSGSVSVPGGIKTPSGGFIGGASAQRLHGGGELSATNAPVQNPTTMFTEGQPAPTAAATTGGTSPLLKYGALPLLGPLAIPAAEIMAIHDLMSRGKAGTQETGSTPPLTGGPNPNPTPGGTPAPSMVNQALNAPIVTPTPAGTPPAIPYPTALPTGVGIGPLGQPLASNDRRRLGSRYAFA